MTDPMPPSASPSPHACPACRLTPGVLIAAAALAETAGVARVAVLLADAANRMPDPTPTPTAHESVEGDPR